MARRSVIECDYCKGECDEDLLHEFVLKKPKSRKGIAFEVCPACHDSLLSVLTGLKQKEVESKIETPKPHEHRSSSIVSQIEDGSFDVKKIVGSRPMLDVNSVEGVCYHPNKDRAEFGVVEVDGDMLTTMYRRCRSCGEKIPLQKKNQEVESIKGLDIRMKEV